MEVRTMKAKEAQQLLKSTGFVPVRCTNGHEIWKHPKIHENAMVPTNKRNLRIDQVRFLLKLVDKVRALEKKTKKERDAVEPSEPVSDDTWYDNIFLPISPKMPKSVVFLALLEQDNRELWSTDAREALELATIQHTGYDLYPYRRQFVGSEMRLFRGISNDGELFECAWRQIYVGPNVFGQDAPPKYRIRGDISFTLRAKDSRVVDGTFCYQVQTRLTVNNRRVSVTTVHLRLDEIDAWSKQWHADRDEACPRPILRDGILYRAVAPVDEEKGTWFWVSGSRKAWRGYATRRQAMRRIGKHHEQHGISAARSEIENDLDRVKEHAKKMMSDRSQQSDEEKTTMEEINGCSDVELYICLPVHSSFGNKTSGGHDTADLARVGCATTAPKHLWADSLEEAQKLYKEYFDGKYTNRWSTYRLRSTGKNRCALSKVGLETSKAKADMGQKKIVSERTLYEGTWPVPMAMYRDHGLIGPGVLSIFRLRMGSRGEWSVRANTRLADQVIEAFGGKRDIRRQIPLAEMLQNLRVEMDKILDRPKTAKKSTAPPPVPQEPHYMEVIANPVLALEPKVSNSRPSVVNEEKPVEDAVEETKPESLETKSDALETKPESGSTSLLARICEKLNTPEVRLVMGRDYRTSDVIDLAIRKLAEDLGVS